MNAVGEKMLGYLRGERDLFKERKRLVETRKKVETSDLTYWLTGRNKRRIERFWKIVLLLQENSRMSISEMSRRLKIPVSTLFDTLKEVEKIFHFTIVLKDTEINVSPGDAIPGEFAYEISVDTREEHTPPV